MSMRLLGARNLKEVVREMVDASNIHHHVVAVPDDKLYHSNCELAQDGSMPFTSLICASQTRACKLFACGRLSPTCESRVSQASFGRAYSSWPQWPSPDLLSAHTYTLASGLSMPFLLSKAECLTAGYPCPRSLYTGLFIHTLLYGLHDVTTGVAICSTCVHMYLDRTCNLTGSFEPSHFR